MKESLRFLLIFPLVWVLAGCVYVAESWEGVEDSDWERRENSNRREISRLVMGMNRETVLARMGQPDFSESYREADGTRMTVLFYRTHRVHADGITTRDETTPLVFREDELSGWGETAYRQLEAPVPG